MVNATDDREAAAAVPGRWPVAVGQRQVLRITNLAAGGDGVARAGELAVFVPLTAPQDLVEAEITELADRYARARLLRVLEPGPDRVAAPCPVFGQCGGCSWQHVDYPAQLQAKRSIVVEALRRLGHVPEPEAVVRPPLGAPLPWAYRHKMAVPLVPGPQGHIRAGFYAMHSHRVVPAEICRIQHPLLDQARAVVVALAEGMGITAYDPRTRRGQLRHLVGRVSHGTGELLLCLVSAQCRLRGAHALAEAIGRALPACVGVVQNINGSLGNAILGPTTVPLWGRDYIVEGLDGLRFLVSAPSFFQVAPAQAAQLYRVALRQAAPGPGDTVCDLYAGVGTLSLYLARAAGQVHAVEEVAEAVRDGRRNASANGLSQVRFHLGPAEVVLPRLLAQGLRPQVVVLDPPRKGASAEVLQAVRQAAPRRIVYVSCNPATLARDLDQLQASGFVLQEVVPVDMFPQTAHVECSALLSSRP